MPIGQFYLIEMTPGNVRRALGPYSTYDAAKADIGESTAHMARKFGMPQVVVGIAEVLGELEVDVLTVTSTTVNKETKKP